jgi:alkylation response protein AidB-like acyl-CoA dehydrogenase
MSGNIAVPSSSTAGFFQPKPKIPNQWTEDRAIQRMAKLFLTDRVLRSKDAEIKQFADDVLSPETFRNIVDAERHPPYVNGDGFTAFGAPQDANALVTSAGWRYLQDFGLREGVVAGGYDTSLGAEARVVQALKVHLFAPSSAMVVCPSGMQDGAIYVLMKELASKVQPTDMPADMIPIRTRVMEAALSRLLDRDPKRAWTSGQWMTERMGGSDVRGTETVAKYVGSADPSLGTDVNGLPLGPWSITGFKFFSSATDCGCSLVLAYTPNGLSCFFAPTRRLLADGSIVMNGIRIQRLKNKLGTHALPTAELEIKDMRAWLVGEEGKGVKVISTVLNNSRFHNSGK